MCLAIPGKIISINDFCLAKIDFDGLEQQASVELLPKAKVGDYVLVHAGFAIEIIQQKEALKTISLLKELN